MTKRLFLISALVSVPVFLAAREPLLPTNVSVITQADVAGRPVYNVADILEGIVGVNIEHDGAPGTRATIKIRGTSASNRTLILLDGTPINDEFNGQVDLTQIPLSVMERIEITRGGASAVYGSNASAGVVNIITTRPDRKGLVADIATAIGRDGFKDSSGRFHGRSILGDLTYTGDHTASGGFQQNEDYKAESHYATMTRSFNGNGFWGADYFYQESRVGTPDGTPRAFDTWNGKVEQEPVDPFAERDENYQQARIRLASPEIADGTIYLTITQGMHDLKLRDVDNGPAMRDENGVSNFGNLSYRRHGFEAGVEAERLKRNLFAETESRSHQNSAYILQKWSSDKLIVAPSLRYDKLAESEGLWNPRLVLVGAIGPSASVSATASRGFRKPTFDELFNGGTATANPDLEPEKSSTYDVGAQWSPGNFLFRVTGFSTRVQDVITAETGRYENDGREKNSGVETEMAVNIRKTRLSANWTAQKSERDTAGSAGFVPSAMTPRNLVSVRIDQGMPWGLTFSNEVRYQSEQFQADNEAGQRVSPYYRWDTRFSIHIWQADLYLGMNNVTNRHYADTILAALSPQPAQMVYGGLSIRFIN